MQRQRIELDVRDERLTAIFAADALLEPLTSGYQFLEGPLWLPSQHALIFSDIPGDTMYRWDEANDAAIYRRPSRKANGNTCDQQGRILTCEHATGRVVRQEGDGSLTVLASHYDGLELNSPNDIVVRSDGAIYFTDPTFGRRPTRAGALLPPHQPCQGVYRLDGETGALTRVADDFDQPNGLCFAPDERRLFVNDSSRGHIRVYDVAEDGGLTGGAVWAEVRGEGRGLPDGMKFDAAGNLYCAGPGGIYVFDERAAWLGTLRMPEHAANFCWGGDDLCDLFICASTTLYRVRVQTSGRLTGG